MPAAGVVGAGPRRAHRVRRDRRVGVAFTVIDLLIDPVRVKWGAAIVGVGLLLGALGPRPEPLAGAPGGRRDPVRGRVQRGGATRCSPSADNRYLVRARAGEAQGWNRGPRIAVRGSDTELTWICVGCRPRRVPMAEPAGAPARRRRTAQLPAEREIDDHTSAISRSSERAATAGGSSRRRSRLQAATSTTTHR